MRRIRFGCCARAATGHAAAERDEVTPFPLTEMHPTPRSQGRIGGYRINEDQSGGSLQGQGESPTKSVPCGGGHCWLTNRKNIPAAINRASRVPTTNEVTGCRLGLTAFDPAPFCAAPIPNQKRSLSIAVSAIIGAALSHA